MEKSITLYNNGTQKFQTIVVPDSSSTQSAAISARRIMISTSGQLPSSANGVQIYVAFGSNPTATNESFVLPPGATIFNFTPGEKVALLSSSSTRVSILDLD